MSEKYGACRRCVGHGFVLLNGSKIECGRCGGTGFSGDAMDLLDSQYALRIKRPKVIEVEAWKRNMDYAVRALGRWKVKIK